MILIIYNEMNVIIVTFYDIFIILYIIISKSVCKVFIIINESNY